MSNEFQHKSVGSQMTQTEYEHTDGTGHIFDSQAAGDILFASSTTVLSRLGIGTAGKVLAVNSGASAPEYVAALTGVTSVLNTALVVGRDADNDIDFATDNNIIFRAAGADQIKLVDGVLQPVTDSDVDLGTTGVRFKDAYIDTVTTTGDVTVGGDLTITGDDLFMGTNTAGHLLIADGTNFNPTAVGDLSEISTVANDDVFIAVDTSGGGLKKIARSAIVAGLATSGAISNVVEDTSPELGGDLDVLTHGIVTGASNRNIALTPHGTGVVRIDGTNGVDIESGAISIKNGGAESYVRFYCESSNAHYTQLQASPHSAYSGNVTVVLPAAATNLVGDDTTQTLTNKRLTSPKINEDVALTSTATELNLLDGVSGLVQADFTKLAAVDATATELNIMDGDTTVGTDAIADDDGIVTNDGGTMKQTKVQTLATYMEGEIDNLTALTQAVFVGKDASITDDTATGVVATMTALTGVSIGELVHIDGNGKIDQAHADASADMPAIGIALESNSSGSDADIKVLLQGFYKDADQFAFTVGTAVFADHSGEGNFTQSPSTTDGHFIQRVGIALTADTLYFSPSLDVIERD
tara:strand:+ start:31646 stop:33397 length:1752 start_codon:yes stop_codon:yes gene_type:complete